MSKIGRLYFPLIFFFEIINELDKIGHYKSAVNIGLFIDEGIFKWEICEPETDNKDKNIMDLYVGINHFKASYKPGK
jgi:hypothetical protein